MEQDILQITEEKRYFWHRMIRSVTPKWQTPSPPFLTISYNYAGARTILQDPTNMNGYGELKTVFIIADYNADEQRHKFM